ncbi:hypothetical protein [Ectobacillus ponti]|nr:hypothetical protein [Ectobacillus ponti]
MKERRPILSDEFIDETVKEINKLYGENLIQPPTEAGNDLAE